MLGPDTSNLNLRQLLKYLHTFKDSYILGFIKVYGFVETSCIVNEAIYVKSSVLIPRESLTIKTKNYC